MANEKNLMDVRELNASRTPEQRKEIAARAGRASGEARRARKNIKSKLKVAMSMPADPKVARALKKTGIDVKDNEDVVIASIIRGVIKGNPQMIEKLLDLLEESPRIKAKKKELKMARERLDMDKQKAELEAEKAKAIIKAIESEEVIEEDDDGFIEALGGKAKDDWSDAE